MKVPLIMVNLPRAGEGRRLSTQVELIDLPPTILSFLDVPVPEQMEGRSLMTVHDDNTRDTGPSFALSYTWRGRKSLETEEGQELWKQRVWDQGIVLESLRVDNRWKLILGNDGRLELYDLREDPRELNDLKAREGEQLTALTEKLVEKSSRLKRYLPRQEQVELSPDDRNKLKALGYL